MAVITSRGGTEMESVYGRKRLAANAGGRETWMDKFAQLQPESGFRAIVEQVWSRCLRTPNRARPLNSRNGRMEMKPVYGQKRLSAEAGVHETWHETWIHRFVKLEPEGGFRAIVERTSNWTTPTADTHVTTLAA
jgi:hypothetical protein